MNSHKWDQDDHQIRAQFVNSGSDTAKTVDFHYCRTCSGSRTEKIVKDEYGFITEWLRYEMEGLNHLRIDERYDSPGDANSVIDDNDPWRVQRVYYNGSGQLGQIVKSTVWDYTSTPTATDYYYGYDILGNVSVISNNSGAEIDQFEQDAFGNEVESSWTSPAGGITEHLTTKQYDADLGLYYFNARWYASGEGLFLSKANYPTFIEERYAGTHSNPILFVDTNGRLPQPLVTPTPPGPPQGPGATPTPIPTVPPVVPTRFPTPPGTPPPAPVDHCGNLACMVAGDCLDCDVGALGRCILNPALIQGGARPCAASCAGCYAGFAPSCIPCGVCLTLSVAHVGYCVRRDCPDWYKVPLESVQCLLDLMSSMAIP